MYLPTYLPTYRQKVEVEKNITKLLLGWGKSQLAKGALLCETLIPGKQHLNIRHKSMMNFFYM